MNKNKIITIKGEEYTLITDFNEDVHCRHSFNRLALKIYGFDFEQWYLQGYMGNKYRPYSLLHKEEIVANISVNPIDFLVEGERHQTVQIGTVMTDSAYRNKGLSRELMNIVLKEYENTCELVYLYANDSVLDFYPKFGFTKAEEYICTKQFVEQAGKLPYRKLKPQDEKDKVIIDRLVFNTLPVSRYSMVDNPQLKMFYLISFMAEDIYYFENLDLAVVVAWDNNRLMLSDVFCEHEFDLDQIINSLVKTVQSKISLGFTPLDDSSYIVEVYKEEDLTYFIKGKNSAEHGRFPALSHA